MGLTTPEKFMPILTHNVKTKATMAPVNAPFTLVLGQKHARKNKPKHGASNALGRLVAIWTTVPPIWLTRKAIPQATPPLTMTEHLAISVAFASDMSPTSGRTISFQMIADRLVREEDSVLSAALNIAAINKPGMPGKEENMSKKVRGMI